MRFQFQPTVRLPGITGLSTDLYPSQKSKFKAVVDVESRHREKGQPVLVGTQAKRNQ